MANKYQATAEEYYELYMAFRNAGFDADRAFDLVLNLCTSQTFTDIAERLRREEVNRLREQSRRLRNEKTCKHSVFDEIYNTTGGSDGKLQDV